MTAQRKRFDWRGIHEELERRLTRVHATYESDEAQVHDLLKERAARLAFVPDRRAAGSLVRLLIFRAGGERCALPLDCTSAIVTIGRIATLPHANPAVAGIINWRGELGVLFNTARLLGGVADAAAPSRYAIVLQGGEPRLALAADEFEGITRADTSALQASHLLGARADELFAGVTGDALPVIGHDKLRVRLSEILRAE